MVMWPFLTLRDTSVRHRLIYPIYTELILPFSDFLWDNIPKVGDHREALPSSQDYVA